MTDLFAARPPLQSGVLEPDRGFVVSTGIECSTPLIAGGVRQDELLLTGHWDRFAEDFAITADLGIRTLRYGVPFHVVAADPDRLDWDWTDRALGSLRDAGLTPVADLLHFGLPARLWGIGDPALPAAYRRYVDAFVRRYPWIRHYTPVNEPWITSVMSARHGLWNERRQDERSMVAALGNVLECVVAGSEIIRAARPDAVFLQSDVCERWIAETDEVRDEVDLLNEQRFVPFELSYGLEPSALALAWLTENGMSDGRLDWLLDHGSPQNAIVGHDYYAGNEHVVFAPGQSRVREPLEGYASVAREYFKRLPMPFFLAETNRVTELAPGWLTSVWNDAVEMADEGLPIRGFCWYSLTDQVDWDTGLAQANGHVDTLGLVDLDRGMRPVGTMYRELALAALEGRVLPLGDEALPEAA